MNIILATLTLLAAQVTKEDIKKLVAAGVSEDVVLTYVRANGPAPKLSADDLVELKQAGAGEKVLAALAAGTTNAPAPRTEVVEKPVYVPQTTYVYSQPAASSYWCSSHYGYDSCSTYVRPVYTYAGYYPRYYGGYYGSGYYRGGYVGYGWGRGYYGGGHCYPRARVGVSVGFRW